MQQALFNMSRGTKGGGIKTTFYTEKWHPIHIGGQDLGKYINKKNLRQSFDYQRFLRDPAGARTRDIRPTINQLVTQF